MSSKTRSGRSLSGAQKPSAPSGPSAPSAPHFSRHFSSFVFLYEAASILSTGIASALSSAVRTARNWNFTAVLPSVIFIELSPAPPYELAKARSRSSSHSGQFLRMYGLHEPHVIQSVQPPAPLSAATSAAPPASLSAALSALPPAAPSPTLSALPPAPSAPKPAASVTYARPLTSIDVPRGVSAFHEATISFHSPVSKASEMYLPSVCPSARARPPPFLFGSRFTAEPRANPSAESMIIRLLMIFPFRENKAPA